jgi:hypothetical protein
MHGCQMVKGVHYDASYSSLVSWTPIYLLLMLPLVLGWWYNRKIDFVLALPQANT